MTDEIDQDVREATEAFKRNALVIIRVLAHQDGEEAEYNSNYLDQMFVQAFARMKEAGRQAGLREAAAAMREAIARGYNAPEVKCEHDRYGWEDCIACYDDALESAITALLEGEGKQ